MRYLTGMRLHGAKRRAGGGGGENQLEIFLSLAAGNAATVVKPLLRALLDGP